MLAFNREELRMAPLIWWDVKTNLSTIQDNAGAPKIEQTPGYIAPKDRQHALPQYAVLGHVTEDVKGVHKPVLLNTNSPWSAFLCGSQGSGKSHTLSCMLENCILSDTAQIKKIGKNPKPLAGLVFHYDRCEGSGVCEAAYLCSEIPTTVLVSPSNSANLTEQYKRIAKERGNIQVEELRLLGKHMNTDRVKTLMAVGKDGDLPLYMQVIMKIIREMAMKTKGLGSFNYAEFCRRACAETFQDRQSGPLKMRMELLESFIHTTSGKTQDFLIGKPGTLTIIDLTDPVVDADSACVLFDICLSVFISQTQCGKIIALDEAHNYMAEDANASKVFTDKLLKTIREQRHKATRVVVATQEPTINPKLLDLCSIIMVHRCTSPAWFDVLKKHVAGLFLNSIAAKKEEGTETEKAELKGGKRLEGDLATFQKIVKLRLGESLLFCPTAAVDMMGNEIVRMEGGYARFRTRMRVTADGGKSKFAGDT
ncbi:uncharacterized protein BDR25DRAFT_236863 [Lindgomyces ingoldianus]|uniref:Uncharacterized protein n=1 Tax=Lindgomyces ingoldianus TaxID=673940 RepID=A0ACB6QI23_9PLEO|nr:uncharacterized protein BDR25DRAFT_236863 [Lindgomyces ingoldianus]KAF2466608.1 hypothetical protein BDR25DRAFT_236863 [Lindgomyces ingoldianus]